MKYRHNDVGVSAKLLLFTFVCAVCENVFNIFQNIYYRPTLCVTCIFAMPFDVAKGVEGFLWPFEKIHIHSVSTDTTLPEGRSRHSKQ